MKKILYTTALLGSLWALAQDTDQYYWECGTPRDTIQNYIYDNSWTGTNDNNSIYDTVVIDGDTLWVGDIHSSHGYVFKDNILVKRLKMIFIEEWDEELEEEYRSEEIEVLENCK